MSSSEFKVILISLDWTRPKDPPLSLGHASILTTLQQYNIPVLAKSWSVNAPHFHIEEVYQFIMSHAKPHTSLALGAYIWHEPHTQYLLQQLKQTEFPGRIILGGPQISYTKRGLEQYYPTADVFIRGYAEKALALLLLSDLERPVIAGVHYAGEPDLGLSATTDLETLPSPFLKKIIKPQTFIRWETQRGCPFRCAFCQHRESDVTTTRRQFSHLRIMQEVEWITQHTLIRDVAILDPTFNSGPYYMAVLEAFIKAGYKGKLALQCRIEMVQKEFLDTIERLNKTGHVVLEFGLQTIHREEEKLIQRPNNINKVKHILIETKNRNIATEVSLIFGLPKQTLASFQASIDFCKALSVPTLYAFPLMLLRGTPLHAQKKELGLIESSDIHIAVNRIQDNIPHVVSSPTFTYADWQKMAQLAESLDSYNAKQALVKARAPLTAKMTSTLKQTMFYNSETT